MFTVTLTKTPFLPPDNIAVLSMPEISKKGPNGPLVSYGDYL